MVSATDNTIPQCNVVSDAFDSGCLAHVLLLSVTSSRADFNPPHHSAFAEAMSRTISGSSAVNLNSFALSLSSSNDTCLVPLLGPPGLPGERGIFSVSLLLL